MEIESLIDIAAGRQPADLVLRNGQVVNVLSDEIYQADVAIAGDRIAGIGQYEGRAVVDLKGQYICPGFIDGHIHVETSMLSVPEFARVVSAHGTTAVVTDPHEIANVLGTEGIRYMLTSSKHCPVRVYIMLSSCVPASGLESAGAELLAMDLLPLLNSKWVLGLAEMMDYRGVVASTREVIDKLKMTQGRTIDGHAPGLSGPDLQAYIAAGIESDHECTTLEEAQEKLRHGMFIMIREGSQARNLQALLPLVTPQTADRFMFVTDDKDVQDLLAKGHMDHIVRQAIAAGLKPTLAVRLASLNTARFYGLKGLGAIAPGYIASLAILKDLKRCEVGRVYYEGQLVAEDGECVSTSAPPARTPIMRSTINVQWLELDHFAIKANNDARQNVQVIEIIEDQLVTDRAIESLPVENGNVMPDPSRNIAKIVVIERHQASGRLGFGFIRGFGLKSGAIASTIAHDAHNIVVAGTNDRDIYEAAVQVIKMRGGLCAVKNGVVLAEMSLPIAGLMSTEPATVADAQLKALHQVTAAELGCTMRRPFMGLSFMSLTVIGSLKVTDFGLVDVDLFELTDLLVP